MLKYSVSEQVIQNLVHSAQSMGLGVSKDMLYVALFPTLSVYEPTEKTLQ